MTQPTLAFIGAGNMAGSIIGGLLQKNYPASSILATARTEASRQRVQQLGAIKVSDDNEAAIQQSDIVILGVKPQMLKELVLSLAPHISSQLVISLAAGISAASINEWLGGDARVVRAMPNTPSLLGAGATGLFANHNCHVEDRQISEHILGATGLALWTENENEMHAITALSGSGPAYFFLFVEAMIAAGTELGLTPDTAAALAQQTALGAARMLCESGDDTVTLRRKVTSPNGTTERAIQTYEDCDLRAIVRKAMGAAANRSIEMSELFK